MNGKKRVIKEFESRVDDIITLKSLLNFTTLSGYVRKQIESEIRKIKAGDAAEKNASYLFGSVYQRQLI